MIWTKSTLSTSLWDYIDSKYKKLRDSIVDSDDRRIKVFDYFHSHIYDGLGGNFTEAIEKTKLDYQNKIKQSDERINGMIENKWSESKNSVRGKFDTAVQRIENELKQKVSEIVSECMEKRSSLESVKLKILKDEYLWLLVALMVLGIIL